MLKEVLLEAVRMAAVLSSVRFLYCLLMYFPSLFAHWACPYSERVCCSILRL